MILICACDDELMTDRDNSERNQLMLRLVLEGRTCREVGEIFGLSIQRVWTIVSRLDPDASKKSGRRRMRQRYPAPDHRPEEKGQ